ncbi:IPT/TIG domain-containing protein [Tieghemostelium lacteum]|uniref:IPT/TIG domain-containing protein n=1 Tax=Tieghemostelium lacteum TaxID=361077 RepID=A0A151Z8B8_TIELA|nr:IPT/TIG domain-containing protein [Tieghemostelium lacteum]|eukprot:KYQ90200.1 IPT/TIG domain-containing protein [Tieghemostelium lacteum]
MNKLYYLLVFLIILNFSYAIKIKKRIGIDNNINNIIIQPPIVRDVFISSENLKKSGDVTAVILGENFGIHKDKVEVVFGNTKVKILSVLPYLIKFQLPTNPVSSKVNVYVNGIKSTQHSRLEIVPIILDLSTDTLTSGGNLTIFGRFFKPEEYIIKIDNVKNGCILLEVSKNGDYIVCEVPPGTGGNKPLQIDNTLNFSNRTFSYAPPAITDIKYNHKYNNLILTGQSFGEPCKIILNLNRQEMECLYPVYDNISTIICLPEEDLSLLTPFSFSIEISVDNVKSLYYDQL